LFLRAQRPPGATLDTGATAEPVRRDLSLEDPFAVHDHRGAMIGWGGNDVSEAL
jgi:hypothetical protein